MKPPSGLRISREKHLDHMVKVTPLIVAFYAIQSYVIFRISPEHFSQMGLTILGVLLALMIGCILTYDLKHLVYVNEKELHVSFLGRDRIIHFEEITSIKFDGEEDSFSNLTIKTTKSSFTFYFIDDAHKIKKWIEDQKTTSSMAA